MAKNLAGLRLHVRNWLAVSSARVADAQIDEAVNDVLEELCAYDLQDNFVVDDSTPVAVIAVAAENAGTTAAATFNGQLDNQNIVPGTLSIVVGTETYTDNGIDGALDSTLAGTGKVSYVLGGFSLTDLNAANQSDAVLATYNYFGPDPLLEVGVPLTLIAGQARYSLPYGFLRPYAVRTSTADNDDLFYALTQISSRQEWFTRFPDPGATASRGRPTHFGIFDGGMWFGPTPDAAYDMYREYYRNLRLSAATDTNSLLQNHDKLVKWGVLAQVSAYVFEDERAPMFADKYERAKREMLSTNKSKGSQGRRPVSRAFGLMPGRINDGE
jgi:hypothetical protein